MLPVLRILHLFFGVGVVSFIFCRRVAFLFCVAAAYVSCGLNDVLLEDRMSVV